MLYLEARATDTKQGTSRTRLTQDTAVSRGLTDTNTFSFWKQQQKIRGHLRATPCQAGNSTGPASNSKACSKNPSAVPQVSAALQTWCQVYVEMQPGAWLANWFLTLPRRSRCRFSGGVKHQLSPADLPDISHSHSRQKATVERKRNVQIKIMWALLLLYLHGVGAESQQGALPCCNYSALPCRNKKSQKVHSERWEAGLELRSQLLPLPKDKHHQQLSSPKYTVRFQEGKPRRIWGSGSSKHSPQTSASLLCTFTPHHQCLFLESMSQLLTT